MWKMTSYVPNKDYTSTTTTIISSESRQTWCHGATQERAVGTLAGSDLGVCLILAFPLEGNNLAQLWPTCDAILLVWLLFLDIHSRRRLFGGSFRCSFRCWGGFRGFGCLFLKLDVLTLCEREELPLGCINLDW